MSLARRVCRRGLSSAAGECAAAARWRPTIGVTRRYAMPSLSRAAATASGGGSGAGGGSGGSGGVGGGSGGVGGGAGPTAPDAVDAVTYAAAAEATLDALEEQLDVLAAHVDELDISNSVWRGACIMCFYVCLCGGGGSSCLKNGARACACCTRSSVC